MDTARQAFAKWARAEAERHHVDHLASRSKGTPTFTPDECPTCSNATSYYRQWQRPFEAGYLARAQAARPTPVDGGQPQ